MKRKPVLTYAEMNAETARLFRAFEALSNLFGDIKGYSERSVEFRSLFS